jgi:hypothetical protein
MIFVNTKKSYQWTLLITQLGRCFCQVTVAGVDTNGFRGTRLKNQEYAPSAKAQIGIGLKSLRAVRNLDEQCYNDYSSYRCGEREGARTPITRINNPILCQIELPAHELEWGAVCKPPLLTISQKSSGTFVCFISSFCVFGLYRPGATLSNPLYAKIFPILIASRFSCRWSPSALNCAIISAVLTVPLEATMPLARARIRSFEAVGGVRPCTGTGGAVGCPCNVRCSCGGIIPPATICGCGFQIPRGQLPPGAYCPIKASNRFSAFRISRQSFDQRIFISIAFSRISLSDARLTTISIKVKSSAECTLSSIFLTPSSLLSLMYHIDIFYVNYHSIEVLYIVYPIMHRRCNHHGSS